MLGDVENRNPIPIGKEDQSGNVYTQSEVFPAVVLDFDFEEFKCFDGQRRIE